MLAPRIVSESSELKIERDMIDDAEKWRAVLARNASMDGLFVVGVRTTGIYCKPSCPSKHPLRENVQFFPGPDEAEKAGFRACMRCRPRAQSSRSELVTRVTEYVNRNLDGKLTLESLSREAGLSPFHLQRVFKKALGISPRQYVEARRLERVKRSLSSGETVTDSVYAAGFTSTSRMYEKGPRKLGVHPGTFRRGGEGLRIQFTIVDSPIGRLLLGATDKGVCAVCIGGSDDAVEAALREDYYAASLARNDDGMKNWAESFLRYFEGQRFPAGLPIDVAGTAFQWKVWKALQAIPYGSTASYSGIAEAIGQPKAVRAVARACATNHVAIIIPCHRVIGRDGELHGYRWGNNMKRSLLDLEARRKMRVT
jgi:AraC family transcriptional regulator, regulatory protein of adaptative response / methylated-DNA-[protein]-cysteine methyltransferase